MGNTDSQYSSFMAPGKPKSCTLKFHSRKEEMQSPHCWWRGSEGGLGYKSRGVGRGYLPQHKNGQPYGPRHYEHLAKGVGKGGPCTKVGPSPPLRYSQGDASRNNGHHYGYLESSGESGGLSACGRQSPSGCGASLREPSESHGSPKVLLSKDGSMRVEFTNARMVPVEGQPLSGHPSATQEPSLRTSKGSSLSSEGSWYDSPWGNAAELTDNVFTCAPPADNSSGYTTYSSIRTEETGCGYTSSSGYNTFSSARTDDTSPAFNTSLLFQTEDSTSQYANTGYNSNGYNTYSSGRTEDSGIGDSVILHPDQRDISLGSSPLSLADLYSTPSMAAPFPTARLQDVPQHRASLASVLDAVIQEEGPEEQRYISQTLPCRKAGPVVAAGNSRKDSLKSRIRRLSDWTGSLSRKKRRLQEPCGGEVSSVFCGPSDPGSAESSSQVTCSSWNPLHTQNQTFSTCPESIPFPRGQQNPNDALRQNIYENFMQELETGGGGGPDRPEPSEEDGDGEEGGGEEGGGEAGSSSGGSLGSLEQLDLLFEKEQGVVRRAGWLSFKPLLTMHKDRKLEMVARRRWRQYWVTLKGCTLLFYETYGKSGPEQELSPRYALLAEDSVVQAIPEHPKKENVFCLSNAYGDVYLFQAASQTDLENWVTAIHSASASLLAKRQGKEDTVRLLRSQTRALLQKIDMDGKMKKMAELQLSVISDQKNRKAIESQILQWEQNLEKFNMDLFRVRCYLASLQGSELPNPKSLLAVAGRPSKMTLGRLGIFSVSSFHALICTRDEATLRRRCRSLSRGMRNKRGLFSSLKGLDSLTKHGRDKRQSASQVFEGQASGQRGPTPSMCSSERLDVPSKMQPTAPSEGLAWYCTLDPPLCVNMPDNQAVTLSLMPDLLVSDVLSLACKERQLDPSLHCLRARRRSGQDWDISTPAPNDLLRNLVYEELEVFPLNVFSIRLSRPHSAVDFGFAVTGHVDGLRKSHVFVSEVSPDGLAFTEGLRAGDEILVLNGASVSKLDLGLMQVFFSHLSLQLLLRREETSSHHPSSTWPDCDASEPCAPAPPPPLSHPLPWPTDMMLVPLDAQQGSIASAIDDMPPPPQLIDDTERLVQGAMCGMLPQEEGREAGHVFSKFSLTFIRQSFKDKLAGVLNKAASCVVWDRAGDGIVLLNVETVCSLYHTFPESCGVVVDGQRNPYSVDTGVQRPCPRHMSISERVCKVIQELVDTEKSYVKDLGCLFNIYLTPLQNETFLSQDEMEALFGSLPEMLDFQKVFLHTLEERVASSPNFSSLETPEQFKKLLFSLGGSFLYYADHFKLYSGFCANHIKVQKVLERAKTDRAFKEFLEARNPTKQHSSTLESYLIKPVQRVLKYPLLLRELVSLTDSESEEHSHLTEALKAMEKVASHINEMQKIYEDYGTVFDQLVAQQSGPEKEVTEISMGEFLIHSSLVWLNPLPSLGRMRKDPELTLFVFKRAVILVYRDNSKMKKRMTTSRSGDLDPFKFRWLIPVSAVQVRLGNAAGTENPCVWELVHTKSQVEGRPETVFQLCSSGLESKASVLKALRSLVRDSTRRGVLPERTSKDLGSLRRNQPPAARAGSLRRRPQRYMEAQKTNHTHSDEGSVSSGSHPGETRSEPQLPSRPTDLPILESNTLGKRARLCSLTSALEAQLQRLNFTEEAVQGTGSQQGDTLRQECPQDHHAQRRAPDEPQCVDFNSILGRDFSVQSLASVINEDCFYDTVMGIQKAAIPTL